MKKTSPREKSDDSDIEEIEFVEKPESFDGTVRDEIPIVEEIRVHFEEQSDSESRGVSSHGNPDSDNIQPPRTVELFPAADRHSPARKCVSCEDQQSGKGVDDEFSANKRDARGKSVDVCLAGRIDFIARNKSMISEYSSRVKTQKNVRKPMTAVLRKRGSRADSVNDNDPRTRNIVRSVQISSFKNKDSNPPASKKNPRRKTLDADWLILNENQFFSFKNLFSKFDQSKNGGISAMELFESVKELLPGEKIPFEDVQKVHAELDIKQTGEIEFDEFLFAMTQPKNYVKLIQDDDRRRLAKEIKLWENLQLNNIERNHRMSDQPNESKNLFFKMVRTATKKESMREIRHFYVNKIKKANDHVIQDWAAGQRCIGLSNEGVVRRFNDITSELNRRRRNYSQKRFKDSPYAQPLHYGLVRMKLNSQQSDRNRTKSPRIPKILKNVDSDIQRAEMEKELSTRRVKSARAPKGQSGRETSQESQKSRVTKRGIPKHSSNIIPGQKTGTVPQKQITRAKSAPQPDRELATSEAKQGGQRRPGGARSAPARRTRDTSITPRTVPLPVFTIKRGEAIDYDNVDKIRRRAADILQEYYNRLKGASAYNWKSIYKRMQVDQISDVQLKQFKRCYSAYLGGWESHVISPWIPHPETSARWTAPLGESCLKTAWT